MSFISRISLILLIALGACANASTVAEEPLRSGEQAMFSASYEKVIDTTISSLREMHITVTQITEQNDGTIILISRHPGAFSWGEVGRVFVEKPSGPNTTIYMVMDRRFSGLSTSNFSDKLFVSINNNINK